MDNRRSLWKGGGVAHGRSRRTHVSVRSLSRGRRSVQPLRPGPALLRPGVRQGGAQSLSARRRAQVPGRQQRTGQACRAFAQMAFTPEEAARFQRRGHRCRDASGSAARALRSPGCDNHCGGQLRARKSRCRRPSASVLPPMCRRPDAMGTARLLAAAPRRSWSTLDQGRPLAAFGKSGDRISHLTARQTRWRRQGAGGDSPQYKPSSITPGSAAMPA